MIKLHLLPNEPTYMGYTIGYGISPHGFRAMWKHHADSTWCEGSLLVDTLEEIPALAHECIGFNLRIAAYERMIERKATIEEITELHRKGLL